MKLIKNLFLSLFALSALISCKKENENLQDGLFANIKTNKGDIVVQLFFDKTPNTVANFVALAEGKNPFVEEQYKGKPYYDGLKFHRVIPNFMIQGGDPLGDGSGGPGYKFKDEFHSDLKHDKAGILSMANAGPNTNGSQFFITHNETPWLDNMHTVFGEVAEGMEVVNSIAKDDVIESITIIRKGKEAKKFDAVKIFKEYYEKQAKELKEEAEKLEQIKLEKRAEIDALKSNGTTTKSGLIYQVLVKGSDEKPKKGTKIFINYAGYFENGELFDTSFESIAEACAQLDPHRVAANAYKPFPFTYGDKQGLIQGFIETFDNMNFGDKLLVFIPSKLGYGAQGYGAIPPNTNLVFEIEMLKEMPTQE